eukprot:scpid57744/ scgid25847/ 
MENISELAPSVGSYDAGDFVLDTLLVIFYTLTAVLAFVVLWKSRLNCCLLDYFFLVELTSGMVIISVFYLPLAAQFLNIWSNITADSFGCQFFGSVLLTMGLMQVVNALFITLLRLLSIGKPFVYDRWFAFNTRLIIPVIVLHVLLPGSGVLIAATAHLDIRIYSNVCLLDLRSASGHTAILIIGVIATSLMAVLFSLHFVLFVAYRRLYKPPVPVKHWDESLLHTVDTLMENTSQNPEQNETQLQEISSLGVEWSKRKTIGYRLNKYAASGNPTLEPRPLQRSLSDTDLPKLVHIDPAMKFFKRTKSLLPRELEPTMQINDASVLVKVSSKEMYLLHCRCHSHTHVSHPIQTQHDRVVHQNARPRSLEKLQLLHHRLKMSPLTKLALAVSMSHVLSKLPGIVFFWLELETQTSPPKFPIWAIRLWITALFVDSFVFVLARRCYKTEVDRLFKAIPRYLRRLANAALCRKRSIVSDPA